MKSMANKEKDGPDKSLTGPFQVKNDEKLYNMISKTEYVAFFYFYFFNKNARFLNFRYTIDQIEAYVSEQKAYSFIAQVFMYISKEESKEE